MLKNYFKIAINHIRNHRLYAFINILGLAVGLACALLIGLYVIDELSYEQFFADHERIYRVSRDLNPGPFSLTGEYPASLNAPFAPQLKAEFPQIEESARLYTFIQPIIMDGAIPNQESGFAFVDASFFNIFQLDWQQGDKASALSNPQSLVLTESMAQQYFPGENPMGKNLTLVSGGDQREFQVTGVIGDLPHNTHLPIRVLAPLTFISSVMGEQFLDNWIGNTDFHTYIKLAPGANIGELESQFPDFLNRHIQVPGGQDIVVIDVIGLVTMNVTDIHLHSTRSEELKPPSRFSNVVAFAAIAIGILLIACINFMNLSTARSSQRSREVGMRKSIGAEKGQLVQQFLGESLVMTTLAMAIALVLVELAMPWFEAFTGKAFTFSWFQDPAIIVSLIGIIALVGLCAGSYPAFYLASYKPSQVLKGNLFRGQGDKLLRQALVVFQFSISIALVIATAVIFAQMQYVRNIDLGLDKEQVVAINGTRARGLGNQWDAMKQQLLDHPGITSATYSHYRPFTHDNNTFPVGKTPGEADDFNRIQIMAVDYDFFTTYGIEIVAGRTFSRERSTDQLIFDTRVSPDLSGALIVNEATARLFNNSPEELAGTDLWLNVGPTGYLPVIGVVEDSYFASMTTAIEPMLFFIAPENFRGTASQPAGAIKITGQDVQGTLAHIENVWREFLPDLPLDMHFLNDDFEALYQLEQQQIEMLTWFTVLAIFIACLGLYGLASFNAERRTKEIGVRKVMGSSVWRIVLLLTNDFSLLVLLSNLIAWPVAYFAMQRWLENFAYRIDLTPLIFIGSGLIALCIAWVTVGGTAARAASQKPVLALRYE